MTFFGLDTVRLAEQRLLGALYQSPADASVLVGDLPSEAFADPAHRDLAWRLLIDTVRPEDAAQLAVWSDAGQDRAADAASAVQTIRAAWRARQRWGAEDAEPVFLVGLVPANDLAGVAARGVA